MKTISHRTRSEYEQFCKQNNKDFIGFVRYDGRFFKHQYARLPVKTRLQKPWDSTETLVQRRGEPFGVMVAFENTEGDLQFGWSAAEPRIVDEKTGKVIRRGDKFSKPIGLYNAIQRAIQNQPFLNPVPHRMIDQFARFIRATADEMLEFHNDWLSKGK